jgi:hypothetical protein
MRFTGYLPLPEDYEYADRFITEYLEMEKRLSASTELKTGDLWSDLWTVVASQSSIWQKSRMFNALPDTYSLLVPIMKAGGTSQQHYNQTIREVSWLEKHGQCLDNIEVGQSENSDAGRGAIANRFIPKGGLVAPAPLIHIPDSNVLKMYEAADDVHDKGKVIPNHDGPSTFQLLLNYCFGHTQSTLLLCPYGMLTSFINHSAEKPNAKMRWSEEMRHPEWRYEPINEWGNEKHAGLSFDFVALRDIDENEEILIDYGKAWEQAWQEHVQNFVPRKNYVPAHELNEMESIVYRTSQERAYQNDKVQLWCRSWYLNRFVRGFQDDAQCRILKQLGKDRYMVQLMSFHSFDYDGITRVDKGEVFWNVPSDAFYFSDIPYTRDHHLFEAFRQSIMIPDELFPDAWKNL